MRCSRGAQINHHSSRFQENLRGFLVFNDTEEQTYLNHREHRANSLRNKIHRSAHHPCGEIVFQYSYRIFLCELCGSTTVSKFIL